MYLLEIRWGTRWVTLPQRFNSRDDAHYAAAQWRSRWGRPTDEGDPFRVAPVTETTLELAEQMA